MSAAEDMNAQPPTLSKDELAERERAEQAQRDAVVLLEREATKRKAFGLSQGWTAARINRALATIDLAKTADVTVTTGCDEEDDAPSKGTKADRALACMRRLPIHRGPSGLILVASDRLVPIPSRDFVDAVRTAWISAYADESLGRATIVRALEMVRADASLATTDRVPPPAPASEVDERRYQRSGELVHVTRAAAPTKKDQTTLKKEHAPIAEGP